MLKINNINKSFSGFKALDNVSINPEIGEIFGLVGSNGCGKTTLLKHIVNIYKGDSGNIYYGDLEITKESKEFGDFYYVQDDLFFPNNFTLNMMFDYEKLLYSNMSKEKYKKLVAFFNLDGDKKLRTMSKGQKKQAAFLIAISANPKVLLLDEIVDGLDAVVKRKFWNVIINEVLENKTTVIISSHDLKELDNICDKVAIMHEGKIVKEEKMEDLKENVKRVQFAISENFEGFKKDGLEVSCFEIIKINKIGSVYFAVIKGNFEKFKKFLYENYNVLIFDTLPMNLEEIFITELGGIGYGIEEYDIK